MTAIDPGVLIAAFMAGLLAVLLSGLLVALALVAFLPQFNFHHGAITNDVTFLVSSAAMMASQTSGSSQGMCGAPERDW